MSLQVVFAGTPAFAVPTLERLYDSSHAVVSVWTQPDRPAGRGRRAQASAIKQWALSQDLPVFQPARLTAACLPKDVPDVMVVVAYGLLLPQVVLDWPRYGCINLHPSLLPRWRGAAPIQHTLLQGDEQTGISVIQMEAGMDSGPILKQCAYPVMPGENSQMLHDRMATLGADWVLKTLTAIEQGAAQPVVQDAALVTYAPKIHKAAALIDWRQAAENIVNQVRAFNPKPVAWTYFHGQRLRIWQADVVEGIASGLPGAIVRADSSGIVVVAGQQCVRIVLLQLAGGRCLSAAEFLNARSDEIVLGETVLQHNEESHEG